MGSSTFWMLTPTTMESLTTLMTTQMVMGLAMSRKSLIDRGNWLDADSDNDGTPDADDQMPFDANETLDFDGDGTGDNADEDDDNDGSPDVDDAFPFDAAESLDTDGDGIGDNADAFPSDATETLDNDADGVGNNADTDDDGDGVEDSDDAFPLDNAESVDTDGDGIGNNSDVCPEVNDADQADADSDGVGDACDLYPADPNYWSMKIADALALIEDDKLRSCIENPDPGTTANALQTAEVSTIHCNPPISSLAGIENFSALNSLMVDNLVYIEQQEVS